MLSGDSLRKYNPRNCGWALEFKIAGCSGRAGMWQCVLGRESLMINGVSGPAHDFFSGFLLGLPSFLEVSELPGDIDRDSLLNLNLGPDIKCLFMMTSADRYDIFMENQTNRMLLLRELAENLIDHVFGYLRPGHFMPVAGPAAVWRIIMAVPAC